GIAGQKRRVTKRSREKVVEGGGSGECPSGQESEATASRKESGLMNQVSSELATKLESVFAAQIGNLINKVIDLVGANYLWEIMEGTKLCKSGDANVRYPAQQRIRNAGGDLVGKANVTRENLKNIVG